MRDKSVWVPSTETSNHSSQTFSEFKDGGANVEFRQLSDSLPLNPLPFDEVEMPGSFGTDILPGESSFEKKG